MRSMESLLQRSYNANQGCCVYTLIMDSHMAGDNLGLVVLVWSLSSLIPWSFVCIIWHLRWGLHRLSDN